MTDRRQVRLAELTRVEAQGVAAAGGVVLVPVGATEQHGPHLPLSTDTMLVEHVATRAALAFRGQTPVIVAPAIPMGCSSHHIEFGGTVSISTSTMLAVLTDVGKSLIGSGFTRVFFVNGHGGNHRLVTQVAQDLAHLHQVYTASASWWHLALDRFVELGALADGNVPGHAGSFETSLVLALRPDLVVNPPAREFGGGRYALGDALSVNNPDSWRAIDGWSDNPAAADAEKGRAYLDAGVDSLAQAVSDFMTSSPLTG